MIDLILGIVPSLIGKLIDNQEVVQLAVDNQGIVTGAVGVIVIDWLLRLIPSKEHHSVIKVLIVVLQSLLSGAKKVDERLAIKKK